MGNSSSEEQTGVEETDPLCFAVANLSEAFQQALQWTSIFNGDKATENYYTIPYFQICEPQHHLLKI
jgi:hypothetical protein